MHILIDEEKQGNTKLQNHLENVCEIFASSNPSTIETSAPRFFDLVLSSTTSGERKYHVFNEQLTAMPKKKISCHFICELEEAKIKMHDVQEGAPRPVKRGSYSPSKPYLTMVVNG